MITGREFILGAELSAADICLGYTLLLCEGQAPLEGEEYANVLAYWRRLQQRPAFAVGTQAPPRRTLVPWNVLIDCVCLQKAVNPTAAKL